MDGILNINKPTGMTSHDVVAKVRKLLKQKRVGHAGTLDPAASGVLPICVGQATRVAEYLSESGKAYQAAIVFGTVTDTYDSEGTIMRTTSTQDLTLSKIEALLPAFIGAQMQVPPRYSAIKLQGQPAYKRARAGEDITMEARPITIYSLEIIDWQPPQSPQPPSLTLAIECSKGTYIRSLAYDLGEQSGYGAYLQALVRTRSGPFTLAESITLEQLAEAIKPESQNVGATLVVARHLHPIDKAMEQYPALMLDEATSERVRHGNAFQHEEKPDMVHEQSLARVYDHLGRFLAIAGWDGEQQIWQPIKVLL
ncbi:MAG TPA: tRNA pseudouridine(55) synthase TruB [Ktedonobacteraceae bacterium]|nr:tRNA pseudouridine(55) synthase TruB [Ktedonobacteraceae bacterium]